MQASPSSPPPLLFPSSGFQRVFCCVPCFTASETIPWDMLGLGFRKGNLISEAGVLLLLFPSLPLEEEEFLALGLQDGLFRYRFRLIAATLVENESWLERKDDKHKRRSTNKGQTSGGRDKKITIKETTKRKKGRRNFFLSFLAFFAETEGRRGIRGGQYRQVQPSPTLGDPPRRRPDWTSF